MNGVDIGLFQFDWDLTWFSFFMNQHGYTYARYGSRKGRGEDAHSTMSTKGLAKVMQGVLQQHKGDHDKKPAKWTPRYPEQIKTLPDNLRSGKECIHCHQIGNFEGKDRGGRPAKEIQELFPRPENIGLTMAVDDPSTVKEVDPKSPAGKAGIKAGDKIVSINGTKVTSDADMSQVLNGAGKNPTIKVGVLRGGGMTPTQGGMGSGGGATVPEIEIVSMTLTGEWRQGDISWRASMWALRPIPGFGGKMLTDDERAQAGLKEPWAMRVNYIVDWGQDAAIGNAVKKAGLAKSDIVVSVAGRGDFKSELEMQSWFRLTQKAGTKVAVVFYRNGQKQTIAIPVSP